MARAEAVKLPVELGEVKIWSAVTGLKCLMCVGTRALAKAQGKEDADLPPEQDAVTMCPYWTSKDIRIGLGPDQVQQMWGVTAVPACRGHVGAESALASG